MVFALALAAAAASNSACPIAAPATRQVPDAVAASNVAHAAFGTRSHKDAYLVKYNGGVWEVSVTDSSKAPLRICASNGAILPSKAR